LSYLQCPLDINVKDTNLPLLLGLLDLFPVCPVEVSVDLLMLKELPSVDILDKVFLGDKDIVDTVFLSCTGLPSGTRDRESETFS
jgi:hypothetical protein